MNCFKVTKTFYEIDLLQFIYHNYKSDIENGTILDIGANIGNHSVFFAKFLNPIKVYAFEPYLSAYNLLLYNIDINKLKNTILPRQLAVSDCTTSVSLIKPATNRLGSTQIDKTSNDDKIKCVSIDDTFKNKNKKITLIKMDVEGEEFNVIVGSMFTIIKYTPILIIEIKTQKLYDMIYSLINPIGYKNIGQFCKTPTYVFKCGD